MISGIEKTVYETKHWIVTHHQRRQWFISIKSINAWEEVPLRKPSLEELVELVPYEDFKNLRNYLYSRGFL
jgi:hypothetical protein